MAQRSTAPNLPGFTHLEWIGGGGFADVFRYQDSLGRRVAVKVQHRGPKSGEGESFDAEAALMAKLSTHPNIVTVYQSGVSADGRPFIVMEECKDHLGARIAKKVQTTSKAMETIIQVAGAVETAHRMGILHRDIKPANILFTEFGRPALTDFGISVAGETGTAGAGLSPLWAPGEQHPGSDKPMGPWSDVFSLAATMWAMLVGHSPLYSPGAANDQLTLRHRARTFNPPATGRLDVPDALERVLATALAREPEQRYRSALEFARALQGVQGQLNESVTPIDVLSDELEEEFFEDPELSDTGTRVSGFMLIDPDDAFDGRTITASGPTGGITSPHDTSEPNRGSSDHQVLSAPVAQHGRGYAAPGIRDFTGPALPEYSEHSARSAPSPKSTPSERGTSQRPKARGAIAVVVSLLVVLVVGGALWGVSASGLLDNGSLSASAPSDEAPTRPQDPIGARVPPVEDLTGKKAGDEVRFTWTNPDPNPGDKYLVEELSVATEQPLQTSSEPEISVPGRPGQTCVNVSLRRGNGRVSDPTRMCVES